MGFKWICECFGHSLFLSITSVYVFLMLTSAPTYPSNPSYPSQREGTSYSALSKTSSANDISPHLTSPEGEGLLLCFDIDWWMQVTIVNDKSPIIRLPWVIIRLPWVIIKLPWVSVPPLRGRLGGGWMSICRVIIIVPPRHRITNREQHL